MCVTAIMQLLIFFISGFMTLFETTFNRYIEKVCGAILCSTFLLYLGLSVALALDRLMIFLSLVHKIRSYISLAVLGSAWLFWLAIVVTEMTPHFNFVYFSQYRFLGWYYDENEHSLELATFEFYYDIATLWANLVLYVFVVLILYRRRNATTHITSWKAEMRVLLIAMSTFLYEFVLVMSGFFGITHLPKTAFSPVLFSVLWIGDCGFFAILTILINSSIRGKIKRALYSNTVVINGTSSTMRRY
uniref:Serpentine receptor class gamma n=1 Tax=Steinernema glaseri TaxID=37863 RepID=A0A1I8AVU2_9BILA